MRCCPASRPFASCGSSSSASEWKAVADFLLSPLALQGRPFRFPARSSQVGLSILPSLPPTSPLQQLPASSYTTPPLALLDIVTTLKAVRWEHYLVRLEVLSPSPYQWILLQIWEGFNLGVRSRPDKTFLGGNKDLSEVQMQAVDE